MSRIISKAEWREIEDLIHTLVPGRSLLSRGQMFDTILENPVRFPALMALSTRHRIELISTVMNQRYPLLNQQGRKPRARVWVLEGGVPCVSC